MKRFLISVVVLCLTGGSQAADFSDFNSVNSPNLSETIEVEGIAVPDVFEEHVKSPKPGAKPEPPAHPLKPPKPVDTTHAYNAGKRDGQRQGEIEGRRKGFEYGKRVGRREGIRDGQREGEYDGKQAGYRDGWRVDQSAGTLRGSTDGENAGRANGIQAGEQRCYDEGYTTGYNAAYAEAKQLGLQDQASYDAGYAKGQAEAAVIEKEKGERAGFEAGFSQRETELENSFPAEMPENTKIFFVTKDLFEGLSIDLARKGYNTPEERRAYDRGFKEGYDKAYRRAYRAAKRKGYDEAYHRAYRRAYDDYYSMGYRDGYSEGREEGYRHAYREAYNSAYSAYYDEYKYREYAGKRSEGLRDGQANGRKEGFEAGCAEQSRRGYKDGYAKTAAEVYPVSFETGKQAGIAAADKYYAENAVLKVFNATFYDEDNDGKFEANENIMLKAEIKNFGFQPSESIAIKVGNERGEIVFVPDLKANAVGGREKSAVNLNIGRLYDVVAPDADTLNVTFSEKGKTIGNYRQMYTRTNDNKVGIVAKDKTAVTKKATWFFPGTITKLDRGTKVLIIGEKGNYYKVRKSEMFIGDWSEGYINKDKLRLQ